MRDILHNAKAEEINSTSSLPVEIFCQVPFQRVILNLLNGVTLKEYFPAT